MENECTHDCASCTSDCKSKKEGIVKEKLNKNSSVKKVIGIVSGKGGVGKSFVTSIFASEFNKTKNVGILDADITGPSIPKMFGVEEKLKTDGKYLIPSKTKQGIDVVSVNLMLENETSPVIWRGPVIAGLVLQFFKDTVWKDIDYLFVDMPPGTGDVPLTVFQSLPVDGIIVVTSPQDLVSMVVKKAVNMAKEMNVPIIGLVENYSYLNCPDCSKKINLFGDSKIEQVAKDYSIPVLLKLPLNPEFARLCDKGKVEEVDLAE